MTRNVEQNRRILDLVHVRGAFREPINGLQRTLPNIPRGATGEHSSEFLVGPGHPDEVARSQEGEYLSAV